jgi:hypothetical protein
MRNEDTWSAAQGPYVYKTLNEKNIIPPAESSSHPNETEWHPLVETLQGNRIRSKS